MTREEKDQIIKVIKSVQLVAITSRDSLGEGLYQDLSKNLIDAAEFFNKEY